MKAALGNISGAAVRTAAPPDVLFEAAERAQAVSLPALRQVSTAPGAPHNRPRSSRRLAWSQHFQLGDVLVAVSLLVLAFVVVRTCQAVTRNAAPGSIESNVSPPCERTRSVPPR